MIVALLNKEQLPALRRLCKKAPNRLSDIFAKVHFAHIRHHLTKQSLEDLISITNHATFGKHVKSIKLSTMHIKIPSGEFGLPDSLSESHDEAIKFRKSGKSVAMLTSALGNLQLHGNHKVSLGVFDNHRSRNYFALDPCTHAESLGHGYIKSYGPGEVLTDVDPCETMFAISEAAKNTRYSLQRLSITTNINTPTSNNLFIHDDAKVLLREGSNQFKSNLTLKHVVSDMFESRSKSLYVEAACLTVEVKTGESSHLSLQGQVIKLDQWKFARVRRTGESLLGLPSVFFDTRYETLTLKDLQLSSRGMTSLCSKTLQKTFKCLEISNMKASVN